MITRCISCWHIVLTLFLLVTTLAVAANTPANAYRSDQILVRFKPGESSGRVAAALGRTEFSVRRVFPALGELRVLAVPADETVVSLIAKLQATGRVELAEPDYWRHLDLRPNDPQFTNGTAWALDNFGQNGGLVDADVDAPEAWELQTRASDIVVAIVDTGIRRTHEDLAANVWTNQSGGYGWNALESNFSPADDEGHGSLVAGVLGAVGNNAKGGAGVAWQVQLLACKSFDAARNGSDADIITGIEFARANGASIINLSLSGTGYSVALSNALALARAQGIIVVASAGNEAANIDVAPRYPACYDLDNIVSVAASTRLDELWSSSNYGATNVDLVAPGHQITSTFTFSDSLYIGPVSGTSFAAPYVAGTCALLRSRYPTESPQQIIARLLLGVDVRPAFVGKCVTGGRLNVRQALSAPVQLTLLSNAGTQPLQLRIQAGPARRCVVEASTNLLSWVPVFTNITAQNGTFDYTAPVTAGRTHEFFRVVTSL